MCACYLIYYYDMEPWDAIRIMRRQRPGSVERKVQEETVVRFFTLLSDYGKESIDRLEQRDKQLMEMQRKAQAELIRCVRSFLYYFTDKKTVKERGSGDTEGHVESDESYALIPYKAKCRGQAREDREDEESTVHAQVRCRGGIYYLLSISNISVLS